MQIPSKPSVPAARAGHRTRRTTERLQASTAFCVAGLHQGATYPPAFSTRLLEGLYVLMHTALTS